MKSEELIHAIGSEYRPTKKGIQYIQDSLMELQNFVTMGMKHLDVIKICGAIAKSTIHEGDKVGLFMENGELVAYVDRKSSSMGIATRTAERGDDVGIKNLEGIVKLELGKILIIEIPGVRNGGTKFVSLRKVKGFYKRARPDRLGIIGPSARVLATKLGLKPDFDFATTAAAIEAARSGLTTMIIAPDDIVSDITRAIDDTNRGSDLNISYEVIPSTKLLSR
jgi:putative transcriptional regulator